MSPRKINHVSPSQLILYEDCPHLWYLRYVKKFWPPKSHPLKFGIAFHDGVESLLKSWGKDVSLDNAISKFEFSYGIGQKGEDPEKWGKKAKEMYQHLLIGLNNLEDFQPIKTEQTLQKGRLRGRLDCLAKMGNEDYLIDWKTTSSPYDQETVTNSLQLTAYCWLTDNQYKPAFILVTKYSTDFYFYPTTRTKKDLINFEDYMDSVIWQMENREAFPKNTEHCGAYGGCDALEAGLCEGRNDF